MAEFARIGVDSGQLLIIDPGYLAPFLNADGDEWLKNLTAPDGVSVWPITIHDRSGQAAGVLLSHFGGDHPVSVKETKEGFVLVL